MALDPVQGCPDLHLHLHVDSMPRARHLRNSCMRQHLLAAPKVQATCQASLCGHFLLTFNVGIPQSWPHAGHATVMRSVPCAAAVSPPLPPEGHQLHDGTQATELEQLQNTAFGPTLAHQALQANINAAGSPAAAEHGTVPLPCCPEAGHSGAKDVLHGSAPGATSIQGPVAAAIDAWALRQLRHKHYGGPLLTDRKPGER